MSYLMEAYRVSHLQWVDLQIQIFVLYQRVDALRKNTLEVAVAWSSPYIGSHHPG